MQKKLSSRLLHAILGILVCSILLVGCQEVQEPPRANGTVVEDTGLEMKNWDAFLAFYDNVLHSRPDHVQIINLTVEGHPIYYVAEYDGSHIKLSVDTSHDPYGSPRVETDLCEGIQKEELENGYSYSLTACRGPSSQPIPLVFDRKNGNASTNLAR